MIINKNLLVILLLILLTGCIQNDKEMDCRKIALALATGEDTDINELDVYESQYFYDFRPLNGLKPNSFTSYYEECKQWTR